MWTPDISFGVRELETVQSVNQLVDALVRRCVDDESHGAVNSGVGGSSDLLEMGQSAWGSVAIGCLSWWLAVRLPNAGWLLG